MDAQARRMTWAVVHQERRALVADLRALRPESWSVPSLCPGWTVHDVVAHLVDSAKTTRLAFARRMVTSRFDFDRDNAIGVDRERAPSPAGTLAELERVVDYTSTPPAPLATRLVEAFVHGEDIRRPLGIPRDYPSAPVASALTYQLATSVTMGGGRERAANVTIVSIDSDIRSGTGAEVHGSTLSLLLAVSGRPVDPAELTGPGAASFLGRGRTE